MLDILSQKKKIPRRDVMIKQFSQTLFLSNISNSKTKVRGLNER